ncbi:MAG TPA: deoxyribose-phosphate aldolase [Casimicrobiaceae bacterium]|nr:deoxyribose-phosphate aldolase [Casimicrobiaceae bacterium]
MTRSELTRLIDHSVLKPESSDGDIRAGADVVRRWKIAFYCVQPCWVARAAQLLADTNARIVTVVGFPHGCDRSDVKARGAAAAHGDGAHEIDMVLNIGALKSGDTVTVGRDIEAVVRAVPGVPVKVILEATVLTDAEKKAGCQLTRDAGAAFVKTSTGFHASGGATVADVRLLRASVGPAFGVKASGGIRTLADALAMIEAGANRIGASASAEILAALKHG